MDSGRGWVAVAGGFLSMATVFGVAYSFGAFFEPMAATFQAGHAATSFVFGLTVFVWFTLGAFTGWLADRFGARLVLLAGAVAMAAGLAATSRVDRLWLGYLTYGAGVGIAVACGYVPAVAAVGARFRRNQALAIGVAVSGIGVGTLVGPPLAAWLIGLGGWRQAFADLAAGSFLLLCLAALLIGPRRALHAEAPRLGPALRSRAFLTLYASVGAQGFALWTFFSYLVPYADTHGVNRVAAAALLSVVGVGSTAGRLLLGPLADRFGRLPVFQAAVAGMVAGYALWLTGPGYPGLVAFALIVGTCYGGWVALSPSVLAELFGSEGLGSLTGIAYTAAGVGALIGPPAAGAVIDSRGYPPAIAGALALQVIGLLILLTLPRSAARS